MLELSRVGAGGACCRLAALTSLATSQDLAATRGRPWLYRSSDWTLLIEGIYKARWREHLAPEQLMRGKACSAVYLG